jgi:hypothetical protein
MCCVAVLQAALHGHRLGLRALEGRGCVLERRIRVSRELFVCGRRGRGGFTLRRFLREPLLEPSDLLLEEGHRWCA